MKPSYEELEQKLAESQREFRAADATIENLQMQVEKLAAENAGLKAAIETHKHGFVRCNCCGDELMCHTDDVCRALDETPATDAFLAEVRASGVDYAIGVIKDCANNLCPGGMGEALQYAQEMVTPYLDSIHDKLADKSAQLRKGVQS